MAPTRSRARDVPKNLKPYFLALFRPGERWNQTEGAEELVPRQLAFLRAQFQSGTYRAAGPIMDAGELTAMALIEAESLEASLAIARQDPAVASGRLTVEVYPALLPALDAVRVEY
jgi:uncharacterized protein YciI